MKVKVQIARSLREYADVIVEAPSVEAAESYVEALIDEGDSSGAYLDMVNNASWNLGSDTDDEEVLDAEPWTGAADAEADVTMPAVETCPHCGVTAPLNLPCPSGCGVEKS